MAELLFANRIVWTKEYKASLLGRLAMFGNFSQEMHKPQPQNSPGPDASVNFQVKLAALFGSTSIRCYSDWLPLQLTPARLMGSKFSSWET